MPTWVSLRKLNNWVDPGDAARPLIVGLRTALGLPEDHNVQQPTFFPCPPSLALFSSQALVLQALSSKKKSLSAVSLVIGHVRVISG